MIAFCPNSNAPAQKTEMTRTICSVHKNLTLAYTGHCGRMRDAFTTVSNTVALRSATVATTVAVSSPMSSFLLHTALSNHDSNENPASPPVFATNLATKFGRFEGH